MANSTRKVFHRLTRRVLTEISGSSLRGPCTPIGQPAPWRSDAETVTPLAATALFSALDEAALRAVEAELEWVHLPGGEILFRQGETGDCLYIVIHGRLRVTVVHGDSNERVVGEVGRGESVGEMAVLTGEPRSATVRAIRDTELLKLSQAGFDRLVAKHPESMRLLARMVVRRLQQVIHRERVGNTLATVAVIPVGHEVPLSDFTGRLAMALGAIGPTLHLNNRSLDDVLGTGTAQTLQADARNSAVVGWLNEQEANHQFVIYEADHTLSSWTSRCLRQADLLLVVGCAEASPGCGEIETALLQQSPDKIPVRKELVLLQRDHRSQPAGTSAWLTARRVDAHHHVRLRSIADFARLARLLAGRAAGLVLGGGGARGFAHIGAIRALTEAGIPIDLIGGASMGAVIAAQYALGWDYETMLHCNRKGWIEMRPLTDYTIPVASLITGRKVLKMLAMMFGDIHIEDLWLPYFCVSSNLTRAEVQVHREGALRKWVSASIAVPGIGPPVFDRGNLLVDGGVLNNLPADVMRSLCAGPVIAVNVTPQVDLVVNDSYRAGLSAWQLLRKWMNPFAEKPSVPTIFDILLRTATLSSAHSAAGVEKQVDLYIHPPLAQFGKFEWRALEQIVEVGYRSAQQQIAGWAGRSTFLNL